MTNSVQPSQARHPEEPRSGVSKDARRLRIDSAVEQGGEVTPFYDPMIAKLIAHAPTRKQAASALADACREVEVWPVKTNAAFLARCLDQPDFVAGDVDTGFIERRLEVLTAWAAPSEALAAIAAAILIDTDEPTDETISPWSPAVGATGFRLNAQPVRSIRLECAGQPIEARLLDLAWDKDEVLVQDGRAIVFDAGEAYELSLPRASGTAGEAASDGAVLSPMPGKIVAVAAVEGAAVAKGAPLVTLEAMKMEHALKAPFDGRVAEVRVAPGGQVSEGALLVRLEPA
ncbi:MAG TPA: biotin/lipoyl-containing protein [Caulobacteraceae bacterium]